MPEWYQQPPLILAIVFIIAGFAVLMKGADLMVLGGVAIAQRFGLSMAVIGATIVAFGTSLPELVVSLGSSIKALQLDAGGDPDGPAAMAIGNVVGSNIFNVGAILGLTALVTVVPIAKSTLRLDYPIMIAALVALMAVSWLGQPHQIGRLEGSVLVLGLIVFTVAAIRLGKVDSDDIPEVTNGANMGKAIGLMVVGIIGLTLGGEVALTGALQVASDLGMSERVIGLTVMAIGTSLPELATSIQAARKGHGEMAIGNVIGSNIFNVLCIIGISSLVIPLPLGAGTLHWDFYWMLGINLLILPMLLAGRIGRLSGVILVLALVTYVTLVLVLPGVGS